MARNGLHHFDSHFESETRECSRRSRCSFVATNLYLASSQCSSEAGTVISSIPPPPFHYAPGISEPGTSRLVAGSLPSSIFLATSLGTIPFMNCAAASASVLSSMNSRE